MVIGRIILDLEAYSNCMTLTVQDPRLISRLHERDKSVIDEIYRLYSGALYNIILKLIPDRDLGAEVLQDTFVKIWQNGDRYDPAKGRLFTWMARIARNTAIDTSRSGKFRQDKKTETLPDSVYEQEAFSQSDDLRDPGLQRVIQRLDSDHRMIIELLYFQQYTQSEVAEKLNMPLGTVKTRTRKALSVLRHSLAGEGLLVFVITLLFTLLYATLGS